MRGDLFIMPSQRKTNVACFYCSSGLWRFEFKASVIKDPQSSTQTLAKSPVENWCECQILKRYRMLDINQSSFEISSANNLLLISASRSIDRLMHDIPLVHLPAEGMVNQAKTAIS